MNTPETVPGTEAAMIASRKALGKAVHVRAWIRLHELWPLAVVNVRHLSPGDEGNSATDTRVTAVQIWSAPRGDPSVYCVFGEARCRLRFDQFDRRRGIDIAFRRALKQIPR